ncbi:hypothetical protein [Citreimonas sp.]|uniref:hypothetical protein n=1 Tax=Citreimonas sp. TaxID=3036715 RepID=UPI00405997FE
MSAPRNPNLVNFTDRTTVRKMLDNAKILRIQLEDACRLLAQRVGLDEHDDAITEAIFNCEDPGEALRLLAATRPGADRAETGRAP